MAASLENTDLISLLRCPKTKRPLVRQGDQLTCPSSGFEGEIVDNVVVTMAATHRSFFDDKFGVMRDGHKAEGEHLFCYAQQMALLESFLTAGMVILDVGCGPALPYHKPPGVRVVGLEPSFHSIHANPDCDMRIFGSAYEIPLADRSIDAVVCIYSIHHMVGRTKAETQGNVAQAFVEFGRVLKPGGLIFVFEMTPLSIFALAQELGWNFVRRLLPEKLDMYFWTAERIVELARNQLPAGTQVEKEFFTTSAFVTFPPMFNLPWLRVPRLIYPLDAKLYKWRVPRG